MNKVSGGVDWDALPTLGLGFITTRHANSRERKRERESQRDERERESERERDREIESVR